MQLIHQILITILNMVVVFAFNSNIEATGVSVAAASQTDSVYSIVTAAGPGGGPHIRAFDSTGEAETEPDKLFAYSEAFRGGLYLAAGDIDRDGLDEIITAPRETGGPQVRVFEKDGTLRGIEIWPFSKNSRTGISVAAGDVDNDNKDEIAVVPAANDAALVKVYEYNDAQEIVGEWLAFGAVECGASVAIGDVNNDGNGEVLVGAGPGGGPQVRIFSADGTYLNQFFAFETSYRGGVDLTVGDLDGDGQHDQIIVSKKQQLPQVSVFNYDDLSQAVSTFHAFDGFPLGAFVETADINTDGVDEIIAGAGADGGPQVRGFDIEGTEVNDLNFFAYDQNFRGGVDIATGSFDQAIMETPPITDNDPPTTTASPAGGTYSSSLSVMLTCNDGDGLGCASIYYTTDGSDPSASSSSYGTVITISSTTTLKYFSQDLAGNNEGVRTGRYIIENPESPDPDPEDPDPDPEEPDPDTDDDPPTTTASPVAGTYNTTKNITLACDDGDGVGCADTYYTTDGVDPTTSSSKYQSPIHISSTTTLKYFSKDTAGNTESTKTSVYTIVSNGGDLDPPTTTASPVAGTYSGAQNITLTCNDVGSDSGESGCANTYYTTDGSDPTTSSAVYSSPISLVSDTTLKYFSTDNIGNEEQVKTAAYVIEAEYTITCLGNSVTTGVPYQGTNDAYPAQMQDMLDLAYGEATFEVSNRGVGGYRADQIYSDLVSEGWMAEDDPDFVLLMAGGNDLSQGQSIASTVNDMQNIVDHVKSYTNQTGATPKIIVSAMIPNNISVPFGAAYVALYNSSLESSLTSVDLWFETNWDDFFDSGGTGGAKVEYMYDTIHPNVTGYEVMAENWKEALGTFVSE